MSPVSPLEVEWASLRAYAQAVPEASMRASRLVEQLSEADAERALALAHHVILYAWRGDARAIALNEALAWARLHHPEAPGLLAHLRRALEERSPRWLHAWLDDQELARTLPPKGRLYDYGWRGASYASSQPLTSLTSNQDQARLMRCHQALHMRLHHADPKVMARALEHPSISCQEALLAASRRPTTGPHQRAIVASRWGELPIIREALVANPFTPSAIALAWAPTLGAAASRQLAQAMREGSLKTLLRACWLTSRQGPVSPSPSPLDGGAPRA